MRAVIVRLEYTQVRELEEDKGGGFRTSPDVSFLLHAALRFTNFTINPAAGTSRCNHI